MEPFEGPLYDLKLISQNPLSANQIEPKPFMEDDVPIGNLQNYNNVPYFNGKS